MTYPDDMWPSQKRQLWWIAASTVVLLLAMAFRLVALQDVPPGLAQDEVLNADIVSFIREGEHSIFFRYGYGHEPLYHYWSVPFQVLLGDNILSIRLPAVVLGLLLVALTLRWAKRDFGAIVAVVAGFGLAVSWWPVIFSRIGLRPIMEPVVILLAALVWPMHPSRGQRNLQRAALAGLALGLTMYTYTAARVLFALPLAYGLYALVLSWSSGQSPVEQKANSPATATTPSRHAWPSPSAYRDQAMYALLALIVMALVALPLFLTLQADPSLQQRVDQLSGPLDALQQGDLSPVLSTTLATLGVFGVTGDPRWTYSIPNRPLFEPPAALLFLAGLGLAALRWRKPQVAFVLIWLIVGLVPSAVTPDAPSSVRLVGAMPVVYLMPGIATASIVAWVHQSQFDGQSSRLLKAALGVALLLIAMLAVGRTVRDGFIVWPTALETRLKYQSVLLDISRDERLASQDMGRLPVGAQPNAPVLVDGFYEPIDDATLRRNLNRDPQARWVQTGAGFGGAVVWPAGTQVVSDEPVYLYVPEFAPVPPDLLARAGISSRPVFRSTAQPAYAVYALPKAEEPDATLVPFVLDGNTLVSLHSVSGQQSDSVKSTAGELVVFSTWQIDGPLPSDLAAFIHLYDSADQVIAQHDGLDAAPETLQVGDRVLQRHVLALPDELPSEGLSLRLGLYRRSDGSRIQTADKREMIDIGRCALISSEDMREELLCDLPDDR